MDIKEVMNAVAYGDKRYQLKRVHSLLVTLKDNKTALKEKRPLKNKNNPEEAFLSSLKLLKSVTECLYMNYTHLKAYIEYMRSLDQCITTFDNFKQSKRHFASLGETLSTLEGDYDRLHKAVRKKSSDICDFPYQNFCVPVLFLHRKFISGRDDVS